MGKVGDGNANNFSIAKLLNNFQPDNKTKQTLTAQTNAAQGAADDSKRGEFLNFGVQNKSKVENSLPVCEEKPATPPDISTQANVSTKSKSVTNSAGVTTVTSKIIIDAGAGDDRINVSQDAANGDVIVSVNGAERRFTGADRNNLIIKAGEGNDTVTVANGVTVALRLEGDGGDDTISVDGGVVSAQTIDAGAGDDRITGGGGRDYINGSTGNDNLSGGVGDDVVYGGDGDDSIGGGGGNDYLEGSRGNDSVAGDRGTDILSGGIGDDNLRGGAGDDTIYAGQGKDSIRGEQGNNRIFSQADDTIADDVSDPKNGIANTVVTVELTGSPGSLSVRVEGSDPFKERVEADLEMLRSSPHGREMLADFDNSFTETRSRLAGLPLVGGLFNDGTTVTIKETDEGNFQTSAGTGRADAEIGYNTSRISLGSGGWTDRPPVVGLYHEMAHADDAVKDTFADGEYHGVDPNNQGVNNLERVAVGLPIDHDGDPNTPEIQDPNHPSNLTENALRDELNLPLRPQY